MNESAIMISQTRLVPKEKIVKLVLQIKGEEKVVSGKEDIEHCQTKKLESTSHTVISKRFDDTDNEL